MPWTLWRERRARRGERGQRPLADCEVCPPAAGFKLDLVEACATVYVQRGLRAPHLLIAARVTSPVRSATPSRRISHKGWPLSSLQGALLSNWEEVQRARRAIMRSLSVGILCVRLHFNYCPLLVAWIFLLKGAQIHLISHGNVCMRAPDDEMCASQSQNPTRGAEIFMYFFLHCQWKVCIWWNIICWNKVYNSTWGGLWLE
jgi:hypothetical protein